MNKGLGGKSYLQRRVMETFTMQCLELSSGCVHKNGGWLGAWTQHRAGGTAVQSCLNNHWVSSSFITGHSRAEVLATYTSVSSASPQPSRPEMLVATRGPQSELGKSVPNERVNWTPKIKCYCHVSSPVSSHFCPQTLVTATVG